MATQVCEKDSLGRKMITNMECLGVGGAQKFQDHCMELACRSIYRMDGVNFGDLFSLR